MFRKYGLPLLAFLGISFSLFMIMQSNKRKPTPEIKFEPSQSPYTHAICAEGIVESLNQNINIGTTIPDLITDVFVNINDTVKKGTPLFKVDTRQQEAELKVAIENLKLAYTNYENQKIQFQYYQNLNNVSAVSKQAYTQALYAMKLAMESMQVSYAEINKIKTSIERSIIIAPIDLTILQVNIRPGEFANANPFTKQALIVAGETNRYQIRVNIAEEDAWRIESGAAATAFVRGNSSLKTKLTFSHIEPYIIPKTALTGSDTEQIDTRVLQVVYTFEKHDLPIYIGQLLDVYVQAKPSNKT